MLPMLTHLTSCTCRRGLRVELSGIKPHPQFGEPGATQPEQLIMPPKYKFSEGEKVLCYHGPLLYEAKVWTLHVQT